MNEQVAQIVSTDLKAAFPAVPTKFEGHFLQVVIPDGFLPLEKRVLAYLEIRYFEIIIADRFCDGFDTYLQIDVVLA